MGDAEALLLVNDDKAQVLEADVLSEQAMGADEDVDLALAQCWKRLLMGWKCCGASTVVGTRKATCLESITALKAARTATSVLP